MLNVLNHHATRARAGPRRELPPLDKYGDATAYERRKRRFDMHAMELELEDELESSDELGPLEGAMSSSSSFSSSPL